MKEKRNLLKNGTVQTLLTSLICIVLGMVIGFIVLLFINPSGAGEAILSVAKNFLTYKSGPMQLKYLGNTVIMWMGGFIPQIIVSLVLAAWLTNTIVKVKGAGL